MNPNADRLVSFASLVGTVRSHWSLILQMSNREIVGRYKGSFIGILWPFLHPIMMLFVYTFVFSVVFKARWVDSSSASESKAEFAFIMFVGMLIHGFFAEVINKAPAIILSNSNYVKKVVFPLEILSVVSLFEGFFHSVVGFAILFLALLIVNHTLPWTVVLLPLILIPYLFFILGVAWFVAALGVFIRDIGQSITVLTTVLLFLSPVFYSKSALPKDFQAWMDLNPLTFVIEQSRCIIIWGHLPDWSALAIYSISSVFIMWLGYVCFQKVRKGFSDVI